MESKQTLGKRIATLRKAQGLTQEQLAEKVGVSAQAVSKWENDMTCPDITTIPLLADIFGVTTDELLGVKPVEPHIVILDKEGQGALALGSAHRGQVERHRVLHHRHPHLHVPDSPLHESDLVPFGRLWQLELHLAYSHLWLGLVGCDQALDCGPRFDGVWRI